MRARTTHFTSHHVGCRDRCDIWCSKYRIVAVEDTALKSLVYPAKSEVRVCAAERTPQCGKEVHEDSGMEGENTPEFEKEALGGTFIISR